MTENPEQVSQWLDWAFSQGPFWAYGVLLLACFIENIFPPFPGDSFIVAAGTMAATGRMDTMISFTLVLVGGPTSVMVMYLLGRRFGHDYFIRRDFKYFSAADIARFETSFQRWGPMLLIFSRFVVGFRSAIAVGAGIGRYQPVKMLLFSFLSYVLFAGLLFYLAWALVENYDRIADYFTTYSTIAWPVVIMVAVGIVVWWIIKVRRNRR